MAMEHVCGLLCGGAGCCLVVEGDFLIKQALSLPEAGSQPSCLAHMADLSSACIAISQAGSQPSGLAKMETEIIESHVNHVMEMSLWRKDILRHAAQMNEGNPCSYIFIPKATRRPCRPHQELLRAPSTKGTSGPEACEVPSTRLTKLTNGPSPCKVPSTRLNWTPPAFCVPQPFLARPLSADGGNP